LWRFFLVCEILKCALQNTAPQHLLLCLCVCVCVCVCRKQVSVSPNLITSPTIISFLTPSTILSISLLFPHPRLWQWSVKQDVREAILVYFILKAHSAGHRQDGFVFTMWVFNANVILRYNSFRKIENLDSLSPVLTNDCGKTFVSFSRNQAVKGRVITSGYSNPVRVEMQMSSLKPNKDTIILSRCMFWGQSQKTIADIAPTAVYIGNSIVLSYIVDCEIYIVFFILH